MPAAKGSKNGTNVLRELPQVYYAAARIRERLPKHLDMEDLVQAGVIGLLDACRNYDSEQDAQFSTFAKTAFAAPFWTVCANWIGDLAPCAGKDVRSPHAPPGLNRSWKARARRRDRSRHEDAY